MYSTLCYEHILGVFLSQIALRESEEIRAVVTLADSAVSESEWHNNGNLQYYAT